MKRFSFDLLMSFALFFPRDFDVVVIARELCFQYGLLLLLPRPL